MCQEIRACCGAARAPNDTLLRGRDVRIKTTLPVTLVSAGLLVFSLGCGGGQGDEEIQPTLEDKAGKVKQDSEKAKTYPDSAYKADPRPYQAPKQPKSGSLSAKFRADYNSYVKGERLKPEAHKALKEEAELFVGEAIGSLLFVESAIVRISLPPLSTPSQDDDDVKADALRASAYALLELPKGIDTLTAEQVAAVALAISSNFPHIESRAIKVIDTNGNEYTESSKDPTLGVTPDYVRRVTERDVKRKVEVLLSEYDAKAEAHVVVALYRDVGRVIYEESREAANPATSGGKADTSGKKVAGTVKESIQKYALVYEPVMDDSLLSVTIPDSFVLSDARTRELKSVLRNATGIPVENIMVAQLSIEKMDAGKRVDTNGDVTTNE